MRNATVRGTQTRFSTEYLSHEQDADGVTVQVRDRLLGVEYAIRARYLIGADGARSKVAADVDLPMQGQMDIAGSMNITFRADMERLVGHRPSVLYWVIQPGADVGGIGAGLVRMVRPWNEWLIVWGYDITQPPPEVDDAAARAIVRNLVGDPDLDVEITGTSLWGNNEQHATSLQRGRVFCAGDAVHKHPPSNGLGSNTSIQDSYNLAWKLAAVLAGQAGPSLLDTYTTERAPVAAQIVARAHRSSREFGGFFDALGLGPGRATPRWSQPSRNARPTPRRARASAPRCCEAMKLKDYEFNAHGVELGQFYESDAIVADGPRPEPTRDPELYYQPSTVPGGRLPHVWVGDSFRRISTHDLAPYGRFTLLTGTAGEAWVEAAGAVATSRGPARRRRDRSGSRGRRPVLRLGRAARGAGGRRDPRASRQARRLAVRHAAGPPARGVAGRARADPAPGGPVTPAFTHDTPAQRVVLASASRPSGSAPSSTGSGASSVMVVAGPRSRPMLQALAPRTRLAWTEVAQHVPVELAARARAAAATAGIDAVVAIGGGSAIGLAKAVALTRPVVVIAVPTTYAGSEATNVWGLTDDGGKRTGVDAASCPPVVYDPELVVSMPTDLVVASGLNAVAHCVDSLWAPRADPINAALATEGLRALRHGLLGLVDRPSDLDAAGRTQYGCYLAAVAFASAGSANAPQDLPRPRGHVRPAARRHPCGGAALRPGVERRRRARGGPAHRRRTRRRGAERALERLRRGWARRVPCATWASPRADLPRAVATALPTIPPSNPRPIDERALADCCTLHGPDAPTAPYRGGDGTTTGRRPGAREAALTETVLASFDATSDPRLRQLIRR